ncbi:MAG TPA: YsnF/AvaK domain-containing protein [Candidatus Angelobacter sp.]|nr:YsnF/AvaK domain-containing protein [Candidatus Angelobacter sp.]
MKMNTINNRLAVAVAALAGLALASGCCSERRQNAAYYSPTPAGYGGTAEQTQYTSGENTSAENMTAQNKTVIPLYKESLNVGTRQVDAGTVRIKKIVKTETVNQPVELRHEEVVIDREPASSAESSSASQPFQESETDIHLTREEPVIQKQIAPAGQIVVQKSSASEQQNVQAQVRRDDVAIVKEGNPQNVTIGQNVEQSEQGGQAGEAMGAAESPGGQGAGQSGSAYSSGPITDPMMLKNTSDPSSLEGRPVQFSNCKVQNVMGDNVVMLTTDQGQSFYAYTSQGATNLKPGDKVTVHGTVRAGNASQSQLSGQSAQILGSQPIYIEAQKIETTQQ